MSEVYEQVQTDVLATAMAQREGHRPWPDIIKEVMARGYELGYRDGYDSRQPEFEELCAASHALQVEAQATEAQVNALRERMDYLQGLPEPT